MGPKEGLDSRVGRRPSPSLGRPLFVPWVVDAVGKALCARVCLFVVVGALRRPGPFVGGGNLVRGATGSVGDFVEAVEAEDSGLEAVGFLVSTRVDNGLEVRPVVPVWLLVGGSILCGLSPIVPGFRTDCDLAIPVFGFVAVCILLSPPPVNLACAAALASSFSCDVVDAVSGDRSLSCSSANCAFSSASLDISTPPKLVVIGLCLGADIVDRVVRCDAATIVPGGSNMLLRLFPSCLGI